MGEHYLKSADIAVIGIKNQRETAVARCLNGELTYALE